MEARTVQAVQEDNILQALGLAHVFCVLVANILSVVQPVALTALRENTNQLKDKRIVRIQALASFRCLDKQMLQHAHLESIQVQPGRVSVLRVHLASSHGPLGIQLVNLALSDGLQVS
jgi:hypothetical protein